MLQMFYMDVAYTLQWFYVFLCVFASVSGAYIKCFICLQTYVASIVFECFKSRLGGIFLLAFCCHALVSPPPSGAGWVSTAPSPLLDAGDIQGQCEKRFAAAAAQTSVPLAKKHRAKLKTQKSHTSPKTHGMVIG
jgi:hypothetical protein